MQCLRRAHKLEEIIFSSGQFFTNILCSSPDSLPPPVPSPNTHCPVPFCTVVQLSPWGPLSHSVLYYEFADKKSSQSRKRKIILTYFDVWGFFSPFELLMECDLTKSVYFATFVLGG